MKAVFGPISSWRFGQVLCVDLATSDRKYCSFDCVYCPQRRPTRGLTRRRWFVASSGVEAQLASVTPDDMGWVTFAGHGEPTLAGNLREIVDLTKAQFGLPVAVLTNSSLMPRDEVKEDLAKADTVVAKLDAPSEDLFQAINRPFVPHRLADIVAALREFREGFAGTLALQMTLLDINKPLFGKMAALAREIGPDEVQLNVASPRGEAKDGRNELTGICQLFTGLRVTGLTLEPATPSPSIESSELPWLKRANAEVMLMGVAS